MANALQCDRCGRLYGYPKQIVTVDRYTVLVLRPYTTNKTLDLCPDCTKALNKFMSECKENNNAED